MRARTYAGITGFILVCVMLTMLLQQIDRTFFRKRSQQASGSVSTAPATSLPATVAVTAPSAASVRQQHRSALVAIKGALSASKEASTSASLWSKEIEPILENDTQEISEEHAEQLAFLFNRDRTPLREIRAMAEELTILRQQVEGLSNSTPPEPIATSEVERIQELNDKVRVAREAWAKSVAQAQAVLRQSGTEKESGETATLRASVDRAKDRETLAALDRERLIEPAAVMTERPIVPIETFDTTDELREQALSTEVASVLAPFLERRTIQPSLAGRFSIKFSRTFDEAPMSLGKLRSIGALDQSPLGLKKLALVGGNRKLPEPRWSVASQPGSWGEGDEEFLKKAQAMLRDYGDILVQEGKLSP